MSKTAFFDLSVILFLICLLGFMAIGIRWLLYGNLQYGGRNAYISTSVIPQELDGLLCEGDNIYDSITKRYSGRIKSLSKELTDGGIRYFFEIEDFRGVASHPLRTKWLWFEYTELVPCVMDGV